jgi:hypothetical protein
MTGQEKGDLIKQGECLIEVTAWAGLSVNNFFDVSTIKHILTDNILLQCLHIGHL